MLTTETLVRELTLVRLDIVGGLREALAELETLAIPFKLDCPLLAIEKMLDCCCRRCDLAEWLLLGVYVVEVIL